MAKRFLKQKFVGLLSAPLFFLSNTRYNVVGNKRKECKNAAQNLWIFLNRVYWLKKKKKEKKYYLKKIYPRSLFCKIVSGRSHCGEKSGSV